jgi:hypothetical protein
MGPPEPGRLSRRPSWLSAAHPGSGRWRPEPSRPGWPQPGPAPRFPPHDTAAADLAALDAIAALAQTDRAALGSDPPLGHTDDGRTAVLDLLDAHLAGGRVARAIGPEHPTAQPRGTGPQATPYERPGNDPHHHHYAPGISVGERAVVPAGNGRR